MKALSVRQPWASAIVLGLKDVENRSRPLRNPPGWVLIHAIQTWNDAWEAPEAIIGLVRIAMNEAFEYKAFGAIIGAARIVASVTDSPSPWFTGPHGWVLAEAVACKPIVCKGKLGFWTPQPDVLELAERYMPKAFATTN